MRVFVAITSAVSAVMLTLGIYAAMTHYEKYPIKKQEIKNEQSK